MSNKNQAKRYVVKPLTEKIMSEETSVETQVVEQAIVQEVAVQEPAPVVEQPVVVKNVVVKPTITIPKDATTIINEMRANGTVYELMLLASIDKYKYVMAPGAPIDADAGAREQYNFWKAISSIVENSPEAEFNKLWSVLLIYVNDNIKGVFDDRYVYRFATNWTWPVVDLKAYQRILNLITVTCDPATRSSNIRKINMHKTLAEGFSEKAKQRISNYYQL